MSCDGCISTIAHGAAGIAKSIVGIDRPPEQTIKDRLRTCWNCDEAQPLTVAGVPIVGKKSQCRACGCVIKAKASIASESCPLHLWEAQ